MARIYYPKKTSTKLLEGALAGLVGGAVAIVLMLVVDAVTPDRSWWSTPSVFGSIFTGVRNFNTGSPDTASLLLGIVLQLVWFGLVGMGFTYYRPLFTRLNWHPAVGGAIYGGLINIALLLSLWGFRGDVVQRQNVILLIIADAIGGAVMGWVLQLLDTRTRSPS